MQSIKLTDLNVNDVVNVNKDTVIIVDFWAPWCGPCQRFLPIFDVVANMHANVLFAKVDITQNSV